jgi:hypothetical protein
MKKEKGAPATEGTLREQQPGEPVARVRQTN